MPNIIKGMTTPKDVEFDLYQKNFDSKTYRTFTIRVDADKDSDVINLLNNVSVKQYITDLIRANQDKKIKYPFSSFTPSVSRCMLYSLKLNLNKDQDVINILDRQSSVSRYILALIRNSQSQVKTIAEVK